MLNPESLAYKEPKRKFRLPSWRKPSKRTGIILSSIAGVAILGVSAWYSYGNLQKQFFPAPQAEPQANNPPPPQQVLGLIEAVEGQGADIPKNEIPSVATIKDLDTLSEQAFFNGAMVGDKLMIYGAAKRAILFRPSTNEIIKQGRVEVTDESNVSGTPEATSASESAEAVLRVRF